MGKIRLSKEFFNIIKKLSTISKAKETVFFKANGRTRITIPNMSLFTHLSACEDDFYIEDDMVFLSSLTEFIKYAETVGYPDKPGDISVIQETSTTGRTYETIKFISKKVICRSMTADPSCFTKMDSKVPCERNEDKIPLLATIRLGTDELVSINDNLRLVPGCNFISLLINDTSVILYMLGKGRQQITQTIDELSTRIVNDINVSIAYKDGKRRMFISNYFILLKGFGLEYDTEIRNFKTAKDDVMMLKSFSTINGVNPENPITIYVGAMESEAASIANYDIIQ